MVGIDLTPAQQEGIKVVDRDVGVLAGAGSGKTRMLAARFLALVTGGICKPREVLALTFTERAAKEMKERIVRALRDQGLHALRQEVESAFITTIHSFCASLLRQYALEAGLAPAFSVMDELEAYQVQREVLRELFSHLHREIDPGLGPVIFTGLLDSEESFINLYGKVRGAGCSFDARALFPAQPSFINEVREEIAGVARVIEQESQSAHLNPAALTNAQLANEAISLMMATPEEGDLPAALSRLTEIRQAIKLMRYKGAEALNQAIKRLRGDVIPHYEGIILDEMAEPVKEALVGLLKEFHHVYTSWKRSRGLLDFSDLEIETRSLFNEQPWVREEVKARYRYLLVDEFQDTNRLQKEILDALRGPGNFFAVGDRRQSIYGFRNAEVEVFDSYLQEVRNSGGELVFLNDNRRSREEVINFINLVFRLQDKEALAPKAEFPPSEGKAIEFILVRAEKKASARKGEAAALAKRLKELVEQGAYQYGEVALLFRSTTDIKVFERALTEADIPFYVVSGRGLFNAREVVDLLCYLKIISNPRDEISLATVLRSPFVALSDDALFYLACWARDREAPLMAAVEEAQGLEGPMAEERQKLARFLEVYYPLKKRYGRVPLWQLILEVVEATGYLYSLLAGGNGRQGYANIRKLAEYARAFEDRALFDKADFLALARRLHIEEVREPEALLSTEKDNVVKLMTVHAAKGLEFPLVAVVDLDRVAPSRKGTLLFSPELGVAFSLKSSGNGQELFSYRRLRDHIRNKEDDEALRILYVAMTRAKDRLLLSASVAKKVEGDWLKYLEEPLQLDLETGTLKGAEARRLVAFSQVALDKEPAWAGPVKGRHEPSPATLEAGCKDAAQRAEAILARVARPMPQAEAGNYLATVSEILTFFLCPRKYYLRYRLALPDLGPWLLAPTFVGEEEAKDELAGSLLGSAAHQALQSYSFREDLAGLEEAVSRSLAHLSGGAFTPQTVEVITSWIAGFYASHLGSQALAARRQTRELPFMVKLGSLMISGRVDLVITGDTGYTIVDFKSDSLDADELPQRARQYRPQMLLYSLAGQALFGYPPEKVALYFLQCQQTLTWEIDSQAMEEAKELTARFENSFKTGSFPAMKGGHCSLCVYRRKSGCWG